MVPAPLLNEIVGSEIPGSPHKTSPRQGEEDHHHLGREGGHHLRRKRRTPSGEREGRDRSGEREEEKIRRERNRR